MEFLNKKIHTHLEFNGLIKKHFQNSEDYRFDLELLYNPPQDYIEEFFDQLKKHKNYEELKDKFIYDDEYDVFIHVHGKFSHTETNDLTEDEIFFYSFMDKKEIKQIFNIKSSADYLLRLRAEQVQGNMRLTRTFSNMKRRLKQKWSFTNHFENKLYSQYLQNLTPERRKICINIPHGTIHATEANGMCIKTPKGNIIVLSYALRHFLFYMNLFHLGHQLDVDEVDTFQSLIIATRILMGTESLDFELDTRGELPKKIKEKIDYYTDWQMKFIIGHEYAHHYLNHLEKRSTLKSHKRIFDKGLEIRHYTHNQKNEFDADFHSISETTYNYFEKGELLDAGFLFFLYLHIIYQIEDYIFPKTGNSYTHPSPKDRIKNLRLTINDDIGASQETLTGLVNHYDDYMKSFLKDFLPYNIETIENYGSAYLPTYKKKKLIDRLDF